ncbi:MAG TPA: nitroreductase [Algoriphagus sp.]|jgi:nitroreductase|uniref:nitroreductase family protein n=1 Tax=Algoriphagus TaxID=246875 RepID=UPI000C5DE2DF|nr:MULTISPECIES: nitroreductase [Algoriphagus]MAL12095.1 nitroreductase [Algoriphagus sp.]QYH40511.1 nitroreductase [Algoriphagus sp. NBT04N3]HAH38796.1 nitroreductase [Algoriphagus sp.]HAS59693.1 nitroreductase [Algoriphagus sp.]HAZ25362.1 nitroreductase [Algoriphagus sp.]|tara:strand:+ start:14592 stop:15200 length:609 start_codon:yes stop_codon:yes gene_type:complete
MQKPDFNIEEVNKIIRGRRSMFVAQFKENDPVDDSIIEEMLENANWAPTHKLTQPWRFIVYTGEGLKKFADYQAELYKKRAEKNRTPFIEATYQKFKENPLKASHVIAILMKRTEGSGIPVMEEIAAVSMAVQNMYLTASAHGLAAYWGTGGPTFWEEAREDFGLEGEDMLMGFFYVAKPATENWPAGKREPIADKVGWIRE